MNIGNFTLWGFVATIILSTIMSASKPLGFTRMDLPFIVGTMFTANRNKASRIGFLIHLALGWMFAFVYAATFENLKLHSWWLGIIIGFIHGAFVLIVGLPLLNYYHPRMATPFQGPTPTRQLEPPGFIALNYGKGTPVVTMIAHLIYGLILGAFYQ
jgi:uncharacterized membrane protein YagU involved in acid resistance